MSYWGIITEVVLRIINYFFAEGEKKDEATRKFLEFVKKRDAAVLRTAVLRRETQVAKKLLIKRRESELMKQVDGQNIGTKMITIKTPSDKIK